MMIGMDARFVGISELAGAPPAAVVVDVMRAFTVAAWAFAAGAEKIVLAGTLDEALALKAGHPDWVTLKDGPPAAGLDAVNSPALLRSAGLEGRTVVQKTTYGTAGALAAREASLVLCASFVVAGATSRAEPPEPRLMPPRSSAEPRCRALPPGSRRTRAAASRESIPMT